MKKRNVPKNMMLVNGVENSDDFIDCIITNTTEGAFVIDPKCKIKDVNTSILKECKVSRQDLIGHFCYEFTQQRNNQCLKNKNKCPLTEVFQTNKPVRFFHEQSKYSKNRRIKEFFAYPFFSEDGNINYKVEFTNGISRHKTLKKKKLLSKHELNLKIKLTDIFLTNPNDEMYGKALYSIIKAMESNYGVFGYLDKAGTLVCPAMTMDLWDLNHFSNNKIILPRRVWRGLWSRALKEKKVFCSNKQFLPPKRNIPIKNAMNVPIVHQDKVIGLIIVGDKEKNYNKNDREMLRNVANYIAPVLHERLKKKNLEKKDERITPGLVEDDNWYQLIFNSMPNLIISIDKDGIITDCNTWINTMLGYDKNEVAGQSFFKIVHPDYHDKVRNLLNNTQTCDSPYNDELKMLRKDGTEIEVSINSLKITDKKGKFDQYIWHIEDITNRKQAEKKIREDCNRAEVYLDILGHDINNLNQAITSYSELLLLKPNLPEQYKKYLQSTFNQSRAISDLISNVRKLSQLKKENFELKNIDIFNVLATASEKVQQTYPFRQIRINQSISESEVLVRSNEMLIYVFINLLNNAVKFDQNNEVVLDISHSLTEDKKFWKIEFKDSGLGVPDILKSRIFKEFEKGNESVRGSGLGLVVVKEIVKSSGGKVWVENKIRGDSSKGSNFIILLPKAN